MDRQLVKKIIVIFSICFTTINCQKCRVTPADVEGPFFKTGAPMKNSTVCDSITPKNKLTISGRVTDRTCSKGVQALMDVWQANGEGKYSDGQSSFDCRTKIETDNQGYYRFSTLWPAQYLQASGYRPAHIHFKVYPHDNTAKRLTTQMYFKNDTYLGEKDSCGNVCHSGEMALQVQPALKQGQGYRATFNIVLNV